MHRELRRLWSGAWRPGDLLQHLCGHLRGQLDEDDRRELQRAIEDHRLVLVPLVVPLTLLRHHVRRVGVLYVAGQSYLEAHPRQLGLRSRV